MSESAPVLEAQPYSAMAGKLDAKLLQALEVMKFQYMTPVQHRVLTELPTWRSDCLVQAKTGTGKTLAFLLPSLHCLLQSQPPAPKGQVAILIITPTRELAQQIAKECDQLTSQLAKPLECHIAVGGTNRSSTLNRFMKGSPSILVATPGRLKDYLSEAPTAAKLAHIQTLVLDEADTMLETGFLADIKRILQLIPSKQSIGWQGMCFSATVPPKVKDVVSIVLKPGYINISTIEKNESPTHERVPQLHVLIPSITDTFTSLLAVIQHEAKTSSKIIVFGITANLVALFANVFSLGLSPMKVFEIHSRLSQNIRTRTTAEFKDASKGIMFASDVIGRGMDFPNVDLVIQVGLPANSDAYIHRVGRTARAGNEGRAVIILAQTESFFLSSNRHLPIKPHPDTAQLNADAQQVAPTVTEAMYKVDETTKQRAYSSYIGFFAGSGLLKPLRMDKAGLVQMANDLAIKGMACPEPPPMDKKVVGKMGLKGIPGFNYANPNELAKERPPQRGVRGGRSGVKDHTNSSTGAVAKVTQHNGESAASGRGGTRGGGRGGGRGGSRGARGPRGQGRGGALQANTVD